jgi:hypothetical protein
MQKSAILFVFLGLWPAAGPALGNEELDLSLPLVMQVCQRDKQEQAAVRIEGRAPAGATIVEAKADLSSDATRGKSTDWMTIAKNGQIEDGRFAGRCVLATGGWFTVLVRARKGAETLTQTKADMVGVGDVFNHCGAMYREAFGLARVLGVKTCIGTEVPSPRDPSVMPAPVLERIRSQKKDPPWLSSLREMQGSAGEPWERVNMPQWISSMLPAAYTGPICRRFRRQGSSTTSK